MRRIAVAAVSFVLAAVAGVFVVGTVNASAATCTGTAAVQITSMTVNPATVAPGQTSAVTLVAQNCTGQPIQAGVQWYARYLGGSVGIPAGCVVFDPLVLPLSLPANGSGTSGMSYPTFPNCTATALQVSPSISAGGTTVASQTATVVISSASPSRS